MSSQIFPFPFLVQAPEIRTRTTRSFNTVIFKSVPLAFLVVLLFSFSTESAAQISVQLPTTRTFRSNSSFFVPDAGTAFVGGVSRNSEGLVSRGLGGGVPYLSPLFNNRAYGRSTTSGGISTSVQIISLREIEQQLLAGTIDRYGRPTTPFYSAKTGNPTASYSWAKKYSIEGIGSRALVSRNTPTSKKTSAFQDRSPKQVSNAGSIQSLQESLGGQNQKESSLPSNAEIRSRAQFLKRFIGRKK